jgi:heat shock protein HtpX
MNKNTFKTFVLLAAFGGLLMGIGSLFGTGGLIIGLGIARLFVGGSYWFSDTIAVKAAGAEPVTEQQAPELYAIVRDLAQRDGMPMPRIYLSPASQPNAFATGRGPQKAVVCVTQGLMQVLDRDELRGVLAHELSHVKNRDILIGSVAAALIQMALSRSREFEADRSGAELLGDGEPLARALEKIDAYAKQVPMNVDPAQATAYIINPLSGRKINCAGLFSTHPPTEERVARLRSKQHA